MAGEEAPAAAPPSFGAYLELSLTALINAPGAFARLAALPAPSPVASFLAALIWGAAYFALNLVHASLAGSELLKAFQPWQIGAVAVVGLGAWSALFLLASSLLYGVGRTLGKEGDFDRALCVAAVTLAAAPASALCSWLPAVWFLPTVISAWIAACGLAKLFAADAWGARGVCAVLAGLALGAQFGAGVAAERYAAASAVAAAAASPASVGTNLRDLQAQMQNVQALTTQSLQAAKPQASGLDLLRGGGADAPDDQQQPASPEDIRRRAVDATANAAELNKSLLAMLDSILPMVNNPAMTAKMTPAQKADFAEVNKMIGELKNSIATNEQMTEKERERRMQKVQELTMRMMTSSLAAMPALPPAGAVKKKK